jgi:putative flippase GtrA
VSIQKINKGSLLWEKIKNKEQVNKEKTILDVLDNLIELEGYGLYHNDIRTWNVVIDATGTSFLIDVGSIHRENKDVIYLVYSEHDYLYSYNTYTSFMGFVYDLITDNSHEEELKTLRQYFLPLFFRNFDENYENFFKKVLLSIDAKDTRVNFQWIKDQFCRYVLNKAALELTLSEHQRYESLQDRGRLLSYGRHHLMLKARTAEDEEARNALEARIAQEAELGKILALRLAHEEEARKALETRVIECIRFIKIEIIGHALVSYVVYAVLVFMHIHYLFANIAALSTSILNISFWNNRHVFRESNDHRHMLRVCPVVAIYGITGFILTNILLYIFIEKLYISKYVAPVICLGITIPLNFIMKRLIKFNTRTHTAS